MKFLNKRLIVKAIFWELSGWILFYFLIKFTPYEAAATSVIWILLRIGMYYYYHQLWKKTKWLKK